MPPLRQDLDLYPGPRSRDGGPTWTLHDPVRNRFFRVGPQQFRLLQHWRHATAGALLEAVNRGSDAPPATLAEVAEVLRFLHGNQLLVSLGSAARLRFTAAHRARPGVWTWLLHHYLFFRLPLAKPDRFLEATLPAVDCLFQPWFRQLLWLLGGVGLVLVSRQWEAFLGTFIHFFNWQGAVQFGVTIALVKVIHELGHAYTAKRLGLRVPTMGVAFIVLWPVLYTDASEAWRLTSRRERLSITTAGVRAELALALLATFLWSFLPDGALRGAVFLVAGTTWVSTLAVNLNPFMRFDGYYFLSDALDVPNLQERAFALGRWRLRELLFGLGDPPPLRFPTRLRRILIGYAFATWVYRLLLFLSIALVVYHLFFKTLGLFLMLVEVVWFVAGPIYREVRFWVAMRARIGGHGRALVSLLLLVGVATLLVIPWNSRIALPAVLRAAAFTRLYPPLPARIEAVHVTRGERVAAGDPLVTLASPDLIHQLRQSRQRLATLELRLRRRAVGAEYLEGSLVLERELAEAATELAGLLDLADKLVVRAPFAGWIAEWDDALTAGRWVDEGLPLGLLLETGEGVVEGYLAETDLQQLPSSGPLKGHFYPEIPELKALPVVVRSLERAASSRLEPPYLASVHGGAVAVRQDRAGQLIPQTPVYRVLLTPGTAFPMALPVVRGTVWLEGVPRSLAGRFFTYAAAVVLRESGF